MKNLKKKLNSRSKSEQFFMLTLLFVTVLGIFCVTGCGGKSCETPKCGSQAYLGGTVRGGLFRGVEDAYHREKDVILLAGLNHVK